MKVLEATGASLDWMVAKCEGKEEEFRNYTGNFCDSMYTPSTDWDQGGPIIERENITGLQKSWHLKTGEVLWHCFIDNGNFQVGPTPLIAAMRCYVASKLGDEVEVPEELI
jgi:hypothetical protein